MPALAWLQIWLPVPVRPAVEPYSTCTAPPTPSGPELMARSVKARRPKSAAAIGRSEAVVQLGTAGTARGVPGEVLAAGRGQAGRRSVQHDNRTGLFETVHGRRVVGNGQVGIPVPVEVTRGQGTAEPDAGDGKDRDVGRGPVLGSGGDQARIRSVDDVHGARAGHGEVGIAVTVEVLVGAGAAGAHGVLGGRGRRRPGATEERAEGQQQRQRRTPAPTLARAALLMTSLSCDSIHRCDCAS